MTWVMVMPLHLRQIATVDSELDLSLVDKHKFDIFEYLRGLTSDPAYPMTMICLRTESLPEHKN